ncbi:MAG: hypothetical protein V2B18_15785 [Pseudomonadota bacterium]
MLTEQERAKVYRYAYIPEHLPDYVQAVSRAEPHIHEDCLCFVRGPFLIFIGYPLRAATAWESDVAVQAAVESACERFQPGIVTLIAPQIPTDDRWTVHETDRYFRVELPLTAIGQDEAYMVRRAAREAIVAEGVFGKEHERLIDGLVSVKRLGPAHQEIFHGIPGYLDHSGTAVLLELRRGNDLIAFSILDLGSEDYGFHLFNFRSYERHVPGASDLLFHEMVRLAQGRGKRFLNLGLGIDAGVRRFKEKWGAGAFVDYGSAAWTRKRRGITDILLGLAGIRP